MALFESYERRIDKINSVLNSLMALLPLKKLRRLRKMTGLDIYDQLRTSEHRSMYSYVRLSIDRCTATYV